MDIDTTPATSYRDGRPAMRLEVPSDDVMMEVDSAAASHPAPSSNNTTDNSLPASQQSPTPQTLFLPSATPATHPARIVDAHSPAIATVPLPPVVLISVSDVMVWPKFKVDELFCEWLQQPDSKPWLQQLLNDVRAGKISPSAELELSHHRSNKHDRSNSPTHSRSPTSSQNIAVHSPQQAPCSPISRLFRNHIPFGDSESLPRSPMSAPPYMRSALQSSDLDLGKSGTVSPLPIPQRPLQKPYSDSTKISDEFAPNSLASDVSMETEATANVTAETKLSQEKTISSTIVTTSDSDADGIAEITAAVHKVSSNDAIHVDADVKREKKSESEMEVILANASTKQAGDDKTTDAPEPQQSLVDDSNPSKQTAEPAAQRVDKPAETIIEPESSAATTSEGTADSGQGTTETSTKNVPDSLQSSSITIPSQTDVEEQKTQNVSKDVGTKELDNTPSALPMLKDGHKIVTGVLPPQKPKQTRKEDTAMTEASTNHPKLKILPKFYFPCGRDAEEREKKEIDGTKKFFAKLKEVKKHSGAARGDLGELVLEVVGLPSYFAGIAFDVIVAMNPSPASVKSGEARDSNSEKNEIIMKDVENKNGNPDATPVAGAAQQQSPRCEGAAKSDTLMSDADEGRVETRHQNGFHGSNTANESSKPATGEGKPAPASTNTREFITEDEFLKFYEAICKGTSKEARLFSVLREHGASRKYLIPSDFRPLLRALLMCHQGLAFLHATPEFQQRYSETVIERIYFACTRQHNGRLTLHDIKRSRLLDTLLLVDAEEDINRERKFFSYEHFYVLYCRFWELDANHDLQIDREDLMRYGSHSLTSRIVDRIFGGHARPLDSPENPGYMSYTDFIWFCLSEEDKTSDTAIDYWFRCVDMDGDGLITMYDMEFFYNEQLHRMECFGHEPVQVKDILCQLLDMIKPNVQPPVIKRKDLKRCRLAGNFFNVLFNLNKFFAIEARDPLQIRQEHATPELTDWDRFAALEYLRLSAEEEEGEEEAWDDGGDAANPLMAGEAPF